MNGRGSPFDHVIWISVDSPTQLAGQVSRLVGILPRHFQADPVSNEGVSTAEPDGRGEQLTPCRPHIIRRWPAIQVTIASMWQERGDICVFVVPPLTVERRGNTTVLLVYTAAEFRANAFAPVGLCIQSGGA
jgi:hypothetical protein